MDSWTLLNKAYGWIHVKATQPPSTEHLGKTKNKKDI